MYRNQVERFSPCLGNDYKFGWIGHILGKCQWTQVINSLYSIKLLDIHKVEKKNFLAPHNLNHKKFLNC